MTDTTLLIDIGNSRIKWFWHNAATPIQANSMPEALAHQNRADWLTELADAWQPHPAPHRCIISHVAGAAKLELIRERLNALFPLTTVDIIRPQPTFKNFQLNYDPAKMGADRYAQLLGAQTIAAQQNHLVISAGTATTIDGVNSGGRHIGGVILPSVHLMRSSLHQYTAQLPVDGGTLTEHAPNTTLDALDTGARLAQIGAVLAFVAHYMPDGVESIIVCGGGAPSLRDDLNMHFHNIQHAPALCLLGLSRTL